MKQCVGLSSVEADKRRTENGPNEIVSQPDSGLSDLKKIFLNPMGLMLLFLGIIYLILGDRTDAFILFFAFIPVTAVDVVLELKASKALRALRSSIKNTAKVFRDGVIQEIPTRNIVVGDAIAFEEGQSIPADGIVVEAHQLSINEAALTGESVPVEKVAQARFFGGTIALQGRGIGLVDCIGKNTRFGKIATLIEETQNEESPLQKKVHDVIKKIFFVALALAAALFLLEFFRNGQVAHSVIVALTFGMAAVPEEFPLVFTLYLSLGAWRLSRHSVLVKSLPSVETLGSVNVICTDKTGTLTEGIFQLEELRPLTDLFSPEELWSTALMACEENPVDAMEIAIFEKAKDYKECLADWRLKWDYPFEAQGKHMSHVWEQRHTSETVITMKGAVEGVLEHCDIDAVTQARLFELLNLLAGQGKRLLGLACRRGPCTGDRASDEKSLRFMGLLIFCDPIRSSVKEAISQCQDAGIQIKMITGDHPLTAHAVADEVGIAHTHDLLFTGDQLAEMPLIQRKVAYEKGALFSRVLPEQKHEMVQVLKQLGNVVAMTGDGINDAPALKLADIGISMGANATDVARSSAKMVLLKNDFNGIIEAVFEGRRIFSNLRRSFSYLISFHIPIVLLSLLPPALGLGDLFLPTHIVLLELIVHPISAFAFENLNERARSKTHVQEKGLVPRHSFIEATLSGLLLSLGSMCLFAVYLKQTDVVVARSVAMATVLLGNIFFMLVEGWPEQSRRITFISLLLISLTAVLVWIPSIGTLFHMVPMAPVDMLLALGVGAAASIPSFLLRLRRSA